MNKNSLPPQRQKDQPGLSSEMNPTPITEDENYIPSFKLSGRTAIITGGDSGIGKAVAILFAKEGCNISIVYKSEHQDAEQTKERIEQIGRSCLLQSGDIGDERFCTEAVEKTIEKFGRLDILINNAGEQHVREHLEDVNYNELDRIFRTNLYGMFFLTNAVLKYFSEGSAIVNTASVTAYKGNPVLIDYSSTKGAIVSFTRSLSLRLASEGIRVNAVAPGPVWTPLIPSSYAENAVERFGTDVPMGRVGHPSEIAPCYLFLVSKDSSYMTGQILHPNGGTIVNG